MRAPVLSAAVTLALLLLVACPRSVMSEYRAAKDRATSDGGATPTQWQPDVALHLSHAMLGDILTQVLSTYGDLEDDVDARVATLHPSLTVKSVSLGRARCDDCIGVGASLVGALAVKSAVGGTEVPLEVDVAFDTRLLVTKEGDEWLLQLQPRGLQDLDVRISGVGLGYATRPVRDWVDRNLLADVPPQEITTLGGDELPLRAVNIVPKAQHVSVELLTDLPHTEPVAIDAGAVVTGWRLDVHPTALVSLAAAQSYAAGPLDHDIVPVPTSLSLEGERFTLGLRLWRVKGRGWWRDYDVKGRVSVNGRNVVFTPRDATKVGRSPGAALADPLAALGQGVILSAIEQALETTLPATHRETMEGLRTRVAAKSISGTAGRISAEGVLIIKPDDGTTKIKRRRRKAKRNR